jgi:hypothetical protein
MPFRLLLTSSPCPQNDAKIAEGTALKTGQASQPTPQTY